MNPQTKWLNQYLDSHPIIPEIDKTIDVISKWLMTDFSYESKKVRLNEWRPDSQALYDFVTAIFVATIQQPLGITYQALIGYMSGYVDCADPLDRAKTAAECIAIAYQCSLIEIVQETDKTYMIYNEFELGDAIPDFAEHLPEFRKPSASVIPILGNRFKKHDQDVCVDHIDAMNSIPLCLETRVLDSIDEPMKAFVTPEQIEQAKDFLEKSDATYEVVVNQGNKFYLKHNFDTRGRCYCVGYYINYQGASYKKAIVQLAHKEVVKL